MKRRHHHYRFWEDWSAGMYRRDPVDQRLVESAGELLACPDSFLNAAALVVVKWRYATEHNLTDLSQNRRAWLGQASATYTVGASRTETCIAWNTFLTSGERDSANRVADSVIAGWTRQAFQLEISYA